MTNQESVQQFDSEWKSLVKALSNLKSSRELLGSQEFQSYYQTFMIGVSKLRPLAKTIDNSSKKDNQAFRSRFFS